MLRLQSAADFERVRRDGRSHAHPLAVLIACPAVFKEIPMENRGAGRRAAVSAGDNAEQAPPTRVGFAAGVSVGKAVRRNRAKRLLREAVRARARDVARGWDLVFIARAPLASASLREAQAAVDALLRRAQVLRHDG
jgi:ribonuclease P protein component